MRIIVNGAMGRMGTALRAVIERGYCNAVLAGSVDGNAAGAETFSSLREVSCEADCIIDFSNHAGVRSLLHYALERHLPVVIATTGHTKEEITAIEAAVREIPVFCSGNLSLGIALLLQTVRKAVAMFPNADVEIVERHHNQKLDVPSGTALMLAHAVQDVRPEARLLIGRRKEGPRAKQEIGIHSLRLGNTIGTHEVLISTENQVISLKQEALDRSLFAEGALEAAAFLVRQPPGLYHMEDLMEERSL